MDYETFIEQNKETVEQIGEEGFYYQAIENRMAELKDEGYNDGQIEDIREELEAKAREYFEKEKEAKESITSKLSGYISKLENYFQVPKKLKKIIRMLIIIDLIAVPIVGTHARDYMGEAMEEEIRSQEAAVETYEQELEAEVHVSSPETEVLSGKELELYNSAWREVGINSDRMLTLESIETSGEREQMEKVNLKIENFDEMFEELDAQHVEMDRVLGTFPLEFLSNMNSISFENIHKKINVEKYGDANASLEVAGEANSEDRSIKVFAGAIENGGVWITNDLIAHELAHLNDWETNKLLTLEERLELFNKVLERIDAEDRYQSSYVESITNDNKQYEKYNKAREYYAEIMEAYFSVSGPMSLPEADRAIVGGVIDKLDPQYDEHAMLSTRLELVREPVSASTTS